MSVADRALTDPPGAPAPDRAMRRLNWLFTATSLTVLEYASSSRLWFESLQNWQSEFLAIWAMVVFSIFLRERGSPESKPVDAPHSQTGAD